MGKDLEHNVFDPSLWSELFTRVKFDSSQKEGYREDLRPALNWGLQIAFLKEKAMQSKWMVENMEVVYPDHVLDHDGKIKESSTHVIVPGLIPLSLKIKTSSSSGLDGLLEMLLPPRTSEDHEVRQQQVIAIINYLVVANTRLIKYNIGFCPGFYLGSYEPGTLKSTTSLIGILASGGDPALFLEAGSSTEAVELLQTLSSFPVVLDDSRAQKKVQNILVGGFQNAVKALIGRGAREKCGGRAFTGHFGEEIFEERNVEGRLLLQDMTKSEEFIASDM